jgi:methyl-accepting chemotaxis protein PixJ
MVYLNPASQSSDSHQIERQPAIPESLLIPPLDPSPEAVAKFGLKAKIMLMAIALGVIPVMVIGAIAYQVTATYVTRQVHLTQQAHTNNLATMLEDYIASRSNEVSSFASSTIFTNPNVIERVTISQKKAALNSFKDQTKFYDNITYLDLKGNPLFQSQSAFPLLNNLSDRQYFQQAISSKQAVMNEVITSPQTGELQIEFAVPVKNGWTDEVIGVMYFRIPREQVQPVFTQQVTEDEQWHLINTENILAASAVENLVNQPIANYYPEILAAHAAQQRATMSGDNPQKPEQEQLVDYAPVKVDTINSQLNLGAAIALDKDIALASLQPLRWIFLGGTMGTTLLVSSIAGLLANRLLQPISTLTAAVERWKQGKLNTRVKLKGQDELAILGARLDEMVEQLNTTVQRQKNQAKTAELIANISQARSTRELQMPLGFFLAKVRQTIETDRVFFCQFDRQWQGTVIAESVALDFPLILGIKFDRSHFAQEEIKRYQNGGIQAFADIDRADLNQAHLQQLKHYGVKAGLILPVILDRQTAGEAEKLVGLLIVHQCYSNRVWQQSDVDYLQQITYQLATVLNAYYAQRHENCQKFDYQQDVAQAASCIEQMSQGNLAIDLSDLGQRSDLAKSLDAFVSNTRHTLAQVKAPATEINSQLTINKQDLANLQENLRQQTDHLKLTFTSIEQILNSTTEASLHAELASEAVSSVVKNIKLEQANFVQAVTFMAELKAYLQNNTDKVNQLNSASQKMTRVIDSIRKINLRASLLASKLRKRIPQLGNSVFGLQEEIESIQQSIAATQELEGLVAAIDSEISGVLQDYANSSNILEQEKDIVANTSKNLEQIVQISQTAQRHLFSLAHTADTQLQTAQTVSNLKFELNKTAKSIYALSDRTVNSLEKTAITAKDLKNVLDFFKLERA